MLLKPRGLVTGRLRPRAVAAAAAAFTPFRATYTDTSQKTSGQTYTFSAADIGPDNANRYIVVYVVHSATTVPASMTVGGTAATLYSSGTQINAWEVTGVTGATGDIVVTLGAATSEYMGIVVCAAYPASGARLDRFTASQTGLNDVVLSDVQIAVGGCLTYFIADPSRDNQVFSTVWSGVDAVAVDVNNAALDALCTYSAGHIICTESSTTLDMTISNTISSTKRGICHSFGAP